MKKIFLSLFVSVIGFSGLAFSSPVAAASRDCDSNAIIHCGALTTSELQQKYNTNATGDLDDVFAHYGISASDIKSMPNVKEGHIHKDGRVVVDGVVVATNAKSVGRHDIDGSSKVTINGKTYYERTPSVSFRSDSLPAFVVLKEDGTFDYAIIKSCGNPVTATNVVKLKEQPKPEPKYTCDSLTATKINRTTYRFDAEATADNGATVTEYEYGFGDGNGITVKDSIYTYEYSEPGTYTAEVTVHFDVNGTSKTATGTQCKVKVTVAEEPKKEEPKKEEPCPYDATLPKDSAECVEEEEPEVVPADEIPKTGPAQLIGAGIGVSSMSAAGYYWIASRRNLIGKILNR